MKIKLSEQEKCEHDWVYANYLLASNPPQQDKICRKCGLKGRDTIGKVSTDEYSETIKKFA